MNTGKDRRRNQASTARTGTGVWFPAEYTARTFVASDLDVLQDLLVLRLSRDRTHVRAGFHGIPDTSLSRDFHQALDEPVVNRPLQEQARTGDAGLAAGGENTGNRTYHGCLELGIRKHDVGRFAPQLQRHLFERACRRLVDLLTGQLRSG